MRIGQGLAISNSRKSKKPSPAVAHICPAEKTSTAKKLKTQSVSDWPANSSATTSRGSVLPVAAIIAGENFTQTKEPANTRTNIAIDTTKAGILKWQSRAKIIAGGSEPHVPGQRGSRPRPKQDVRNLFISFFATESTEHTEITW